MIAYNGNERLPSRLTETLLCLPFLTQSELDAASERDGDIMDSPQCIIHGSPYRINYFVQGMVL